MYVMNFVIATLCASISWIVVVVFTLRFVRANTSGKRWSRRRFIVCTLAYIRICLQVRLASCSTAAFNLHFASSDANMQ